MSFPLPPDLPVPVDDGAADHLEGMMMPAVRLPTTASTEINLADAARDPGSIGAEVAGAHTLVLYIYPRTGIPGVPLPDGWDDIPGARGCTPQSCAYRDSLARFGELGAVVAGLSAQSEAEQAEFAAREHIPFPLLSDPGLALAGALRLPTFEVAGMMLYKRLTLVARAGRIVKAFYPVFPPDRDAGEVLGWLGSADATG